MTDAALRGAGQPRQSVHPHPGRFWCGIGESKLRGDDRRQASDQSCLMQSRRAGDACRRGHLHPSVDKVHCGDSPRSALDCHPVAFLSWRRGADCVAACSRWGYKRMAMSWAPCHRFDWRRTSRRPSKAARRKAPVADIYTHRNGASTKPETSDTVT